MLDDDYSLHEGDYEAPCSDTRPHAVLLVAAAVSLHELAEHSLVNLAIWQPNIIIYELHPSLLFIASD